jgi:hypothetical protein
VALFRKRKQDEDDAEFVDDLDDEDRAAEDAELEAELEAEQAPPPLVRPTGPWDVADAPEDGLQRLDLGALQIPVPGGVEVRVDLNEAREVVAASLVQGESTLQVNVFAAPRTEGIWSEVVEEIKASLLQGGGEAGHGEGPFGPELYAKVPTQTEQGVVQLPARFVGVDGPRWFLRALITGPAAGDREAAAELEATLRGIVVVRGGDPMAVREPLPMSLPPEAQAAQEAAERGESHDLGLPERGPEITEVR